MEDFDKDPLDLLDDDGDGVNEMCLLFDEEEKKRQRINRQPSNSGCCVALLAMGSSLLMVGWGIAKIMS